MKLKEFWEKNGQPIAGSVALLAVYAVVAYSCFGGEPEKSKAPKKEASKESTTVRQDVSSMWHRLKCAVKFCDEDGKCPVWSSKYSKCYMLDSAGVNELDMYVKLGCTSKEYEKRELCF